MGSVSENIIFQKVKNGDTQAFRVLFQKYYQPLFLFVLKFVDKELAKDFVQDCFYELWKNRERIEISTSISAYLFTIVKNRCYKHLKTELKKKQHQNSYALKLKQEELQFYINSEKSILEFAIQDRIAKVINQLPEKCSDIFKESRFKGYSNKEIAQKHNISIKAVEKHITKALQLFRKEFKDIICLLILLLLGRI